MTTLLRRRARRLTAIGATLLITVAASCGSDESSDSTSPTTAGSSTVAPDSSTATSPDSIDTTISSTDSTGDSTVSTGGSTDTTLDASGSGTVADRAAIVNLLLAQASSAGVEVDSECILDIVSRLSDEDAALLGESARGGGSDSPVLSEEGEALGDELNNCAIAPATTSG